MAASDAQAGARTPEQIQREIEKHREGLAGAVEELRAATDVGAMVRAKLPIATAGALGAGFLLAGGFGATVRLLLRRGRGGHHRARVGRFSLVDRD